MLLKTDILDDVSQAAAIIRRGGIVAFATETVFGLGVDATNKMAVERLFVAKGRPSDNPLIVHVASIDDWPLVASELPSSARMLLRRFSPGPLTVVLPKSDAISDKVTCGLSTVGMRVPATEQARELIRQAGVPVAAPSANLSGRPSCTTWESVKEDLDGRIDAVLRGQPSSVGLESTVVDCTGKVPVVLRPGGVSLEQLQAVIPGTQSVRFNQPESYASTPGSPPSVASPTSPTSAASASPASADAEQLLRASPGTRHPHYQPQAEVRLLPFGLEKLDWQETLSQLYRGGSLTADHKLAYLGVTPLADPNPIAWDCRFSDLDSYARGFYESLREADRRGMAAIFIELAEPSNRGVALRDRQTRAAGENPR